MAIRYRYNETSIERSYATIYTEMSTGESQEEKNRTMGENILSVIKIVYNVERINI